MLLDNAEGYRSTGEMAVMVGESDMAKLCIGGGVSQSTRTKEAHKHFNMAACLVDIYIVLIVYPRKKNPETV